MLNFLGGFFLVICFICFICFEVFLGVSIIFIEFVSMSWHILMMWIIHHIHDILASFVSHVL